RGRDALRSGCGVAAVRVVAGSPEEARQGIDAWAPGALVVPFPERPELSGALVVAPRQSGTSYSRDDRALLETLAAQASVAITNARAWAEIELLERRAREENAYLREAALPAADSGELVGQSLGLRSVLAQVQQV